MSLRLSLSRAPLIALAVCVFAPLGIARGQAPNQAPARTYPSIPGAIEVPPAWLAADKDVPFDLKAFFAMPPASQNAAPLYLDALFEFGGDVIGCFAPGPDTDARHQKAMDRSNRARPRSRPCPTRPGSTARRSPRSCRSTRRASASSRRPRPARTASSPRASASTRCCRTSRRRGKWRG